MLPLEFEGGVGSNFHAKMEFSQHQQLTPIILATQEAEIRRIMVRSQSRQIVHEILSQKTLHKNRAGGVAQGEGPEFKSQ
jgi:hypothetical protein